MGGLCVLPARCTYISVAQVWERVLWGLWATCESLQNFKLKDENIQKGMIQNTVLILWLVLSKRPQLQVVYISFSYILLNLLWLVSNICHGFCCSDFRELTCSITHWIVVIIAPLWSFMTRIVAPFTGLLTATRPFFPAERITWPVQWGTKKSSKATTGWNIKFYFQNSNAQKSKSFLWVFSLNKVT